MAISRRNFLQVGAVAAVAAGAPLSKSVFASKRNGTWVSSTGIPLMSKSIFVSVLNTSFEILPDRKQKVRVELVEVQDLQRPSKTLKTRMGDECFSLAFRSSSHPRLKQQTYRIRHNGLGEFDLFIGAVKSEKYGMVYEAIINQVVS